MQLQHLDDRTRLLGVPRLSDRTWTLSKVLFMSFSSGAMPHVFLGGGEDVFARGTRTHSIVSAAVGPFPTHC